MDANLDNFDLSIMTHLQRDASLSMDELADLVHLSRNACWRRVKRLETDGIIRGKVVLLDADAVGCGLNVMVMIRASQHDAAWLDQFNKTVSAMPEIVGAYRMSGDLDYLLRVRVRDVAAYDAFYKSLIARVAVRNCL